MISSIPKLSFSILSEGRNSLDKNGLLTIKKLLNGEENDKRQRYSEEELMYMINLVFLTVVYRNYKVIEGKKKSLNLIEYMVRNQLKYSAKDFNFCRKSG